mmetsp:Transcript_14567/g.24172  ORF Transcript_14567/g.24172 Transcript_14567/m.24172 type:complete len:208 (-) Transcript_14567:193-816(-)|eukprot:CAMPEP_0119003988 /NCGR_PEP_ID=MMETSP1176-20130426/884_1 /TAXON_ID=265551 /ORGANISM="Synedropsis recta cf, Strain CCMP1620" /LENGTH=207 /DNA_ID=CAMNT_0006955641 /DNA_START=54 /DNA_END=677 /DNA_ORIENTATION=+
MNLKALFLSLLSLLALLSLCHGEVVELTDATFEHETQASTGMTTGSWFILFKAEQCAHCKKLKPDFERLSNDELLLERGIVFSSVDVPSNRVTSARFNVKGFPVLHYLHKGRLYKYKGQRSHDALRTFLLETVETLPGSPIPDPISGMTVFVRELMSAGQELMDAVQGENGMVGLAILGMVVVFFGLVVVIIGMFFWPSKNDKKKKK